MRFLRRWIKPSLPKAVRNAERRRTVEDHQTRSLIQELSNAAPGYGDAALSLGMLQLQQFIHTPEQTTLHEAATNLRRAVELLPESAEAHFYLALAESFTLDTADEAEQHLQRAIELDPKLATQAGEIRTRIAAALSGLAQQAIDRPTLEAAVARYKQAQTLIEQGRLPDAIDVLNAALQLYPAYAEACVALGDAYRRAGEIDQAIAALRRALAIRPNLFEAHVSLGALYVQRKDFERALQHLLLALEQAPEQPQVLRNVGLLQLETDRSADAVKTFERLVALVPHDPEPRVQLAAALLRSGDQLRTREVLDQLREIGLNERQRTVVASIHDQLGEHETAERYRVGPDRA